MLVASSNLFAYLLVGALAPGEPADVSSSATSESTASESVGVPGGEVATESAAAPTEASASTSTTSTTEASSATPAPTDTPEPEAAEVEAIAPSASSTAGFSSAVPGGQGRDTGAAPLRGEIPPEYGPAYEPEPPSDTMSVSDRRRESPPFLSLGSGAFCFVEAAACRSALIASADVGAGINAIAGDRGVDLPMTQFSFRGGFTVRPVTLLRKRWHPWSVGVVGSYVRSSGTVASSSSTIGSANPELVDVAFTNGTRVALLNQVWLSQKRHAFHLDFSLGVVRSTVLNSTDRFFGTHADVALGVGGWGALFVAADFLDRDTRLAFGFRGHGIAAAPVATLIALGLLAGGAL